MKILLFGASGMVGKGVLLECLDAPDVEKVVSLSRTPCGVEHAKLEEVLHPDFLDYSGLDDALTGVDACFFCLGVSAGGMSEEKYTTITYGFTLAAAEALLAKSPQAVFTYVSGQGTDSSEKGRQMWARVKGRTENKLLSMPFRGTYMFRPGMIEATRGVTSKTPAYRAFYAALGWAFPLARRLAPNQLTTTDRIGRAMLQVAREGYTKTLLDPVDINALGQGAGGA